MAVVRFCFLYFFWMFVIGFGFWEGMYLNDKEHTLGKHLSAARFAGFPSLSLHSTDKFRLDFSTLAYLDSRGVNR